MRSNSHNHGTAHGSSGIARGVGGSGNSAGDRASSAADICGSGMHSHRGKSTRQR